MSWEEKKGYFKIRQSQAGKGGRGGGRHTKERTFGQQTANSNNLTTLLHIRPDLATVYKNEVTQLKK